MNIEFSVPAGSQLKKGQYRNTVQQAFEQIGALLPEVYEGLSEEDITNLNILVMDGVDGEGSVTTPHSTDRFRFRIKLVPEQKTALEEVIAHELCHVVQFVQRRIEPLSGRSDALLWKSEVYELPSRAYKDRPWEQEAMFKANIIYSKLLGRKNRS